MIRMNQIKLPYDHKPDDLKKLVAKTLGAKPDDLKEVKTIKISIDARKKPQIYKVYTVDIALKNEKAFAFKIKKLKLSYVDEIPYHLPEHGSIVLKHRPVIIGTGPAGLFCGLMLAREGYRPILLERGDSAAARKEKMEAFWNGGPLNVRSNAQFGEGGAGTFSDGKLNTLVKDTFGRNKEVLRIFAQAGAPEEICYINKPHIGTDVLIDVVQNIRNEIIEKGGEVHFCTKMIDIQMENTADCRQVKSIIIEREDETTEQIMTDVLVLAIGHSARDTFEMLYKKGIPMEAKAFAVGVRIEHPQKMIQDSQYSADCPYDMPAADYKLTHTAACGRGVYSFCMCPGGYVVNASSEEGRLAVNGMSYQARDSHNANSAMIVSVTPEDFPGNEPLSGMEFQRKLEEKAFELGNGKIPQQLFGDFCANTATTQYGSFRSCVKGPVSFANLRKLFSEEICEALEEGIKAGSKRINGFDRNDAILSGVESRTSSPIRILRGSGCQSEIAGLYPCGEGAGYAGGITSAAMDGLKVAEEIIKKYK